MNTQSCECRKARKRPIPFDCKLGAGHDGSCSPYTLPPGRVSELTETGRSVRYTGRPIMTMIAEALGPNEPNA